MTDSWRLCGGARIVALVAERKPSEVAFRRIVLVVEPVGYVPHGVSTLPEGLRGLR